MVGFADLTNAFNANAVAGAPDSYQAQQLRQQIAMRLLGQQHKYPKNIGEGLSSIGDSISEAMQTRALTQALAAQQGSSQQLQRDFPPVPQRTSEDQPTEQTATNQPLTTTVSYRPQDEEPAPVRQAEPIVAPPPSNVASIPMPRQAPEVGPATPNIPTSPGFPASTRPRLDPTIEFAGRTDPTYTPAPSTGPTTRSEAAPWLRATGEGYDAMQPPDPRAAGINMLRDRMRGSDAGGTQMASLTGGEVQSDMPPPGVTPQAAPQRDRIASLLAGGSAALGAPQEGAFPPPDQARMPQLAALQTSPDLLTSPSEAATNPPIRSDIAAQPTQVAENAYTGRNLGPLARPAPPVQTAPDPTADPRPTPPPQPPRTPESPAQQRYTQEAIRRQGLGDNPANVKYLLDQAAELEKDRAFKDATAKEEYQKALDRHNAADAAWRLRQSPASRAEEMAKIEEANIVQRTGRKPEQFYPEMTKEQSAASQAVMSQNAQQLARKAIRDGVITGYGANFRTQADAFANWALKNGMGNDMAANTQIMSAALKSGLAQAIETINGVGGRVSDQDVKIAQGIQGTDPELQMKTIKALMDRASEINNMKIDRYEGMVHNYLGKGSPYGPHPQEQTYATTPTPVTTPDKLKTFLDTQKEGADPAQAAAHRRFFDEAYGPGAAQLEISRQRRRGGR